MLSNFLADAPNEINVQFKSTLVTSWLQQPPVHKDQWSSYIPWKKYKMRSFAWWSSVKIPPSPLHNGKQYDYYIVHVDAPYEDVTL